MILVAGALLTVRTAGMSSGASYSAEDIKHEVLQLPKLVPEVEEGNIEYKLKLCK
jgi:hypothetical protein